jgi:hypothetical protein
VGDGDKVAGVVGTWEMMTGMWAKRGSDMEESGKRALWNILFRSFSNRDFDSWLTRNRTKFVIGALSHIPQMLN